MKQMDGIMAAKPNVHAPAPGWFGTFQWWRYPRGSTAHDVVTGAHILFIIIAPCIWPSLMAVGAWGDPLRRWLGW